MQSLILQTFQQLQAEGAVGGSNSTPAKATEEVYESDPVPDQDEAAWMEVADRIDPQGALAG